MFNSDKDTSIYTRKQRQDIITGKTHGKVDTHAQCGRLPIRKVDAVDLPFPNKPVIHRRNPKTQVNLELHDFEKINLSTEQRDHLVDQRHNFSDIGETTGSLNSKRGLHRLPIEQLQMTGTICAKELMLQQKLWRVEEKIRQTIQSESAHATAEDKHKTGKDMPHRGRIERREAPTKAKLSEHQRSEPVRGRNVSDKEHLCDDLKQPRNKQYQRTEDGIKKKHDIQHTRWEVHENEMTRTQNKTRLQNANKSYRGKKDEKYFGDWEETDKHSKHSEVPLGDKDWTNEKKYRERVHDNDSHDEQDVPQMRVQKSVYRLAAKNQRGAGENLSGQSNLPLVSNTSHYSQQQQAEPAVMDTRNDSHQLLPCKFCKRKFRIERVEKHTQICGKLNQSKRQVFNSYLGRTKGSEIEHFFKTHTRSKTPEVLKRKNKRKQHQEGNGSRNISYLYPGGRPSGNTQLKLSK